MRLRNKNVSLINKLIEKTNNQTINWTITSNPEKFVLFLKNNQITIERSNWRTGNPLYKFVITDSFGNVVESVIYNRLEIETGSFQSIQRLFDIVQSRINYTTESTIDSIMSELG